MGKIIFNSAITHVPESVGEIISGMQAAIDALQSIADIMNAGCPSDPFWQ